MFNHLITTMDTYKEDAKHGSIIDTSKLAGSLKEYQKVVAVGSMVREVKEGDLIMINPARYAVMKHQEGSLKDGIITDNPVIKYNFKTVVMDGVEYLLLTDQDISYIIEDYDDESSTIIKPEKKKLIL